MFGIGAPELVLILIIGLIVFGPGKLPELGRTLGKTINEFRRMTDNIMSEVNVEDSKPAKKAPQKTVAEAKPAADPKPVAEEAKPAAEPKKEA